MYKEIGKIIVGFIFSAITLAFIALMAWYPITIVIGIGIYLCWMVGDNLFTNAEEQDENNK